MPAGVAAGTASRISFSFFTMVLTLDSLILKWWVTAAAGLNLRCIPSNSAFSYNVMTSLCFLGALPPSLVALRMGPLVLFRVFGITLNTMENTQELGKVTSDCSM